MLSTQETDPSRHNAGRSFFLIRWIKRFWHWLFPPTLAEQDRQSGTARMIGRLTIVLACIGMIVIAIIYAKPVQDAWQRWRAEQLVKDATKALDAGDPVNAFILSQDALKMDFDYVPAIRLAASLLTGAGKNQAIFFWERLQNMGVSTLEDEIGYVRALMKLQRTKEAEDHLVDLIDQHPADASLIRVAEEVWGEGSAHARVLPKLKQYAASANADSNTKLMAVNLQLSSADAGERDEGRTTLLKLTAGTDETALQALRILSDRDDLSNDERRRLVEMLPSHPLAVEQDRITAFANKVILDPLRKDKLIEAELVRTRDLKRDELFPITRWLVENGEFGRLIAFVNVDEIKTHERLVLNYMTALTGLGRFAELEQLVDDPQTRITRAVRLFQKAHLTFIKGLAKKDIPLDALREQLDRAKDAAILEKRSDILLVIADYAEQRNLPDLATQVYRYAALNMPKVERKAFSGWLRCARRAGDTSSFASAAREGSRRWPDDQGFAESVLYADLLTGEHVEAQLSRATKLLELRPDNSARKLIVALGYWRLGDPATAVKNLMNINLNDVSIGQQAIFAALARSSGFLKEADLVENNIPARASMLPEEREALARSKQ